jgi:AcrR family transcriptional regulator
VLAAAKAAFEERGWAGTTMPLVAEAAQVSPKTIEALFGTKARLLQAAVDYAIRGDTDEAPMVSRPIAVAIAQAPDAATMLERHVEYLLTVTGRSARIALAVETAAGADGQVSQLWGRMTHNRRFGARWAADLLMSKPGHRRGLSADEAAEIFVVAIDWATYRTLRVELALTPDQLRSWYRRYYRRLLLP